MHTDPSASSSNIPEGLLLFPCRSRVPARVRDAAPRAANGAARRTAGELAYEVGIERGIPDVSIAREMDTPFHRVLLSGLVYARARLTIGPCFNRRSGSQPAGQPLHLTSCGCFTWILLTSSCSLLLSPILRRGETSGCCAE